MDRTPVDGKTLSAFLLAIYRSTIARLFFVLVLAAGIALTSALTSRGSAQDSTNAHVASTFVKPHKASPADATSRRIPNYTSAQAAATPDCRPMSDSLGSTDLTYQVLPAPTGTTLCSATSKDGYSMLLSVQPHGTASEVIQNETTAFTDPSDITCLPSHSSAPATYTMGIQSVRVWAICSVDELSIGKTGVKYWILTKDHKFETIQFTWPVQNHSSGSWNNVVAMIAGARLLHHSS